MATAQLAKLSPPRLGKVYLRTRLFQQLDSARQRHQVTWISAPAGAGKTTLITSYLEHRKLKPLWYQIDEGDADPASFFYYLGLLGKQAAPRKKQPLPLLTPEYLLGLPTFTRNFFRELYSRIKAPGVFVLDNYQELPDNAALHELLPIALDELPPHLQLLFISRAEPPKTFVRSRVGGILSVVDPATLRLTLEECTAITRLHDHGDTHSAELIGQLHQQTEGWTAGLILMLEGAGKLAIPEHLRHGEPQLLFDYFATELFDQADTETQSFLMKTGVLPFFTEQDARQLTGLDNARSILHSLLKRNYFITAHPGVHIHYEYHPLFQAFLADRATTEYSQQQISQLKQRSAELLVQAGDTDMAVSLLLQVQDWATATKLILQQASSLLAQGRSQTLTNWLQALPVPLREQQPWILYWLGMCRLPFDPAEARGYFELAFTQFNQLQDATPIYLVWSVIVSSYVMEWSNLTPLGKWLDLYATLRGDREPPSPEAEAAALASYFLGLSWCRFETPDLPEVTQRVQAWFLSANDPNQWASIGRTIVSCYFWKGEIYQAQ